MTAARDETAAHVVRCRSCHLMVTGGEWPFAVRERAAIERHWARRKAETPTFFNGVIHILLRHAIRDGVFHGAYARTDFASYLYWREHGYCDASVRDGFGSAILRSREGHVVLGRQQPGNVNSGQAYLPGGFVDARDVGSDGRVDIEGSIAREIGEETGLGIRDLVRGDGFLVTFAGPLISFGAEYRAPDTSADLVGRIRSHIASQSDPELADVEVVASAADIDPAVMPLYTRTLLASLLAQS